LSGIADLADLASAQGAGDRRPRRTGDPRRTSMNRGMQDSGLVTLFPNTILDFSFLAIGGVQSIVMHRALPIVGWYYLWLGVRVHNLDITSSGGKFDVQLFQTLPSEEDPKEFTSATADMTGTVVTGSPALITPVTGNNLGPYLKVVVRATMGSSLGHLYGELSAGLMGRAN
jgi:hypothetical protein